MDGYSEIRTSVYVGDLCSFFNYISERGPSVLACRWDLLLYRLKVGRFLWFDWEGVCLATTSL